MIAKLKTLPMDPHSSYETIVGKYADAWDSSLASDLQNQFSLLVMELTEHNHQGVLAELRNIFPEWEWEGENGGFKNEVIFSDAAERLYKLLNNKRQPKILLSHIDPQVRCDNFI